MIAAPKAVFTNNVGAFADDLQTTTDEALVAMGKAYQEGVQARLQRGFRTGQFVTGKGARSVKVSDARTIRNDRVVHVYSSDWRLRLWEFGHQNRWTRRFEREPHWRATAVAMGQDLATIALNSYGDMKRYWNPNWKPGSGRSHLRRRQKR
jgi:hypothetical protein